MKHDFAAQVALLVHVGPHRRIQPLGHQQAQAGAVQQLFEGLVPHGALGGLHLQHLGQKGDFGLAGRHGHQNLLPDFSRPTGDFAGAAFQLPQLRFQPGKLLLLVLDGRAERKLLLVQRLPGLVQPAL
ncbi:hypothetical protein [Hymenobacter antarcticus]|uniref:hypothetical protein n=1 Tax=Hymenobacter antarcticus TaxID=486270 RepID=UPI0031EE48A5